MSFIQWSNALSTNPSLEKAIAEVTDKVQRELTSSPDLGIVCISSAFASDYSRLMPILLEQISLPCIVGCGGGGIVGMKDGEGAVEVEGNPALSLTVASLPQVQVNPFHILEEQLPDLDSPPETWSNLIGVSPQQEPDFILLADPFSSKINELIEGLDFAYAGSVKVGGLASSGTMGFPSGLFYYNGDGSEPMYHNQGTVGVALSGEITVESIVAQGCRPIGEVFQVVQGERNIILQLSAGSGRSDSPLNLLRNLIDSLSESDRELAQHSLFLGIARDEFKLELQQGDFLIRNLVGVDPKYGAVAIGDRIRPGQRVQFHLRDARTSAEDLELLLANYRARPQKISHPVGALMFSCLGRGRGLYGKPNFDSQLFARYFPQVPLGGFFCNGEIGPVGGSTFLHGYTSVFAIFS